MKLIDVDIMIESLAHLICGEVSYDPAAKLDRAHQRWHKIPSSRFDGFEPFHPEDGNGDDDEYILLGTNVTDQPIWPMDVCVASPILGEWQEGSWCFRRIRTLPLKEWRGKLMSMTPKMIEISFLVSEPNGRQISVKLPYGLTKAGPLCLRTSISAGSPSGAGDNTYAIHPTWFGGAKVQRDDDMGIDRLMRISAGIALRRQYLWSVLIGEGDGPRARFVTDAIGVREAFRFRDIPPGEARRKALLHWVRSHWRKRRYIGAADKSWIKEHLRGQWSYVWNGLQCHIEPSLDDMEKTARKSA